MSDNDHIVEYIGKFTLAFTAQGFWVEWRGDARSRILRALCYKDGYGYEVAVTVEEISLAALGKSRLIGKQLERVTNVLRVAREADARRGD